jgi:hypothetical protein
MNKKVDNPTRTFKHKKVKGRSLTDTRQLHWLKVKRSREIKEMTIEYNAKYDGRPIFGAAHVVLLNFDMSVPQYLNRELTREEYQTHFLNSGRYNNYKRLRV